MKIIMIILIIIIIITIIIIRARPIQNFSPDYSLYNIEGKITEC